MKNKLQKITIICILILLIISTTIPTLAFSWGEISAQADSFINQGAQKGNTLISQDKMAELVTGLGGILTVIGVAIVLIGILILGIKYMTASPDEAAKLKTKLVGLVIAGVVIIGAWAIWNLTYTFLSGTFK